MIVFYTVVGCLLPVVFAAVAPFLYADEDDDMVGTKPSGPDDGAGEQ